MSKKERFLSEGSSSFFKTVIGTAVAANIFALVAGVSAYYIEVAYNKFMEWLEK